jgi:hypothetical protein
VSSLHKMLLIVALTMAAAPASAAGKDGRGDTAALAVWIDGRVDKFLEDSGTTPPPLVDDATFLRRAYVDLLGTIPTVAQVRDYLDDPSPQKRDALIDELLADERFNAQLARSWRRILLPGDQQAGPLSAAFEGWLREQFAVDARFDGVARQIVTAGGAEERDDDGESERRDNRDNDDDRDRDAGAVAYLQAAGADPASIAGAISRDFLGVRIECAQCHDHPFADWKQNQFWGVAAFFAGASVNQAGVIDADGQRGRSRDSDVATISPPDVGKTFDAEFLWSDKPINDDDDRLPRQIFASWLTSADNPHFAATAVNRVWRQLCGRGLTQSVDDLDAATPEERGAVLDELARQFSGKGFDLKWLVGGICKSRPYQYSAQGDDSMVAAVGVRPLKVLSPEQVFDALETAVGLPISRLDDGPRFNGERDQMVARLSEAASKAPEEFRGGVPQMLMLMNGVTTADAVNLDASRTLRAIVDAPFLDDAEKLDVLFLATLTRHPTDNERERLAQRIADPQQPGGKPEAFAEILWALVNGPEFVLLR